MTDTINIAYRPGLSHAKRKTVLGAAKALAQVKSQMERIPLPHLKEEGADRCPACGCPVAEFGMVPCK